MSDQGRWLRITNCRNIPLREGRSIVVAGREIAVFNLGGRFLAVANRCPHKKGPLSEGIVSGATVVCPLHAWKVNLETGVAESGSDARHCVRTFRTRVVDNIVMVELPVESPVKEAVTAGRAKEEEPSSWLEPLRRDEERIEA